MALFAIGDTHLSISTGKTMDIFGGWSDYEKRLESNWNRLIRPEDTVVIPGDISWAMSLPEAEKDFEFFALHRKLSTALVSYKTVLFHGSAIMLNNKGIIFTAPSGTGKSTHIRLWKKYLGDDVKIVNGDKPFISLEDEPMIYGSPWAGKENWHRNCKMPLKGICFVQRGTTNSIRRIEASDCLSLLFKQVYLPADTLAAGLTLELVDMLIKKVPLYVLTCDMSEDAVRCSFEALTGLSYPVS